MTDLLTENARLRAALEQIVALNIAASLPWTHEQAADNYWRMIDSMKGIARAALATPAPDAPMPEHERDGLGRPVNPAAPQEAVYLGQHSVAPAPDAVQEAARVLLAACPNPLFDRLKPIIMGEVTESIEYTDDVGNERFYKRNVSWTAMKEIIALALRAIAGGQP